MRILNLQIDRITEEIHVSFTEDTKTKTLPPAPGKFTFLCLNALLKRVNNTILKWQFFLLQIERFFSE